MDKRRRDNESQARFKRCLTLISLSSYLLFLKFVCKSLFYNIVLNFIHNMFNMDIPRIIQTVNLTKVRMLSLKMR